MTRWGWVACLILSGCSAHRFECRQHGGEAVYEVTSNHFQVVGELPPADLQREVVKLERLWDAYSVFFNHEPTESSARLLVVMMAAGGSNEFIENTSGFMAGEDTPVLVTETLETSQQVLSSSAHELVHLVSQSWLRRQPRWFAEALAEYLGDAEFKSSDTVRFGRWRDSVSTTVVPLQALWRWKPRNADETRTLYFSAWAWLHYFANRDEARLRKLLVALQRPVPALEAFETVFPSKEWAALHDRVVAYVAAGRFSGWESRTRRTPEVSALRELSGSEVHLVRRLLFKKLREPKKAAGESALALELSVKPTPAAVAVAHIDDTVSGPERTDAVAPYKDSLEGALSWAAGKDLPLYERLAALQALRERAPDSLEALLAFAEIAQRLNDARGLEAAQRARALAPWSLRAALLDAGFLMHAGRCADAKLAVQAARAMASEMTGAERSVEQVEGQLPQCREAK